MNVYKENGYEDREDYLECLAVDYDMDDTLIHEIANTMGPEEDFDGLVSFCQDYEHLNS